MKYLLPLILYAFSLNMLAQSEEHAGHYEFYSGNNDNYYLKDKLSLNPNGTFLFRSESYVEDRMQRERLVYGKGTWTSNKQLILLTVNTNDVDAKHVLNLNNTKLRYHTKSPRDKTNRDIKTSVRIIDTEISMFKGRTLIKDANTAVAIKNVICCKSVWQAHSYLQGKWKSKNDSNKAYHYAFIDEKGVFIAYEKNSKGVFEPINKDPSTFRIIKNENEFKIEKNFNGLKIYSTIKYLDSTKLILVRRDGKENTLYRVKE